MADIDILDELKSDPGTNKFLKFRKTETFNDLIEVMKKVPQTKDILDDFLQGSEADAKKGKMIKEIIKGIDENMKKTQDPESLEFLKAQKESLEKKIPKRKSPTLSFVLEWLLKTSGVKEVRELAE